MKIEVDVDDITLFADALNNAVAAYGDILFGIFIGCEIPSKLEKLKEIPFDELQKRFDCIKNVYEQVLKIENDISDKGVEPDGFHKKQGSTGCSGYIDQEDQDDIFGLCR